jgi:serine/threonine-protein kinase
VRVDPEYDAPGATREGYQRIGIPSQSTGGAVGSGARACVDATVACVMRSRYALVDLVGAGGMGEVWRAWDRRERRWVAVKLLAGHDAASLERFVREQSMLVRHRHVVQPTARDTRGDRTLFTMDLVRGGSLEQLLERHGPLPDSYVRVVLAQLLEALVAVHAAGVVHRDVKPGNLLLEPTGTGRPWVRLGDFGVAVLSSDPRLTQVPGGVGTRGYMAPEQVAGAPPDPRQDLYAAGVVATELLTGDGPGGPVPDSELGSLLRRLTDPDPARRPVSGDEALALLHELGVPHGAPWQGTPEAPDVVDLYDEPRAPGRASRPHMPAYAWGVPAVFGCAALVGAGVTWPFVR